MCRLSVLFHNAFHILLGADFRQITNRNVKDMLRALGPDDVMGHLHQHFVGSSLVNLGWC